MATNTSPTSIPMAVARHLHPAARRSANGERGRVRPARTASEWAQATAMLHDYAVWLRAAAGVDVSSVQPAFASELAGLAAAYGSADSTLLVADDGLIVCGMVAVRCCDDGTAELKRLYVRPVARGGGHADRLVAGAVDAAARAGARRIWLETLPGTMDAAIALYGRHGFRRDLATTSAIEVTGVIVMSRELDA